MVRLNWLRNEGLGSLEHTHIRSWAWAQSESAGHESLSQAPTLWVKLQLFTWRRFEGYHVRVSETSRGRSCASTLLMEWMAWKQSLQTICRRVVQAFVASNRFKQSCMVQDFDEQKGETRNGGASCVAWISPWSPSTGIRFNKTLRLGGNRFARWHCLQSSWA